MKKLFGMPFYSEVDKGSGGGTNEDPKQSEVDQVDQTNVDPKNVEDKGAKKDDGRLTKEEVQKLIQSETDKVRGDYSKKLKEKEDALEKLMNETMTEEEKKERALQEASEKLAEREAELAKKALTLETIDLLKENNLPLEVKDFLIGSDLESTQKNIEAFKDMFSKALEDAVTERLKSTSKKHNDGNDSGIRYTQEDIKKMSPEEINKNWDKISRDLSK